jgi:hypothetical protein
VTRPEHPEIPAFIQDTIERLEAILEPGRPFLIRDLAHANAALGTLSAFGRYLEAGPEEWKADPILRDFANRCHALREQAVVWSCQMRDIHQPGHRTLGIAPIEMVRTQPISVFRMEIVACTLPGAQRIPEMGPEVECKGHELLEEAMKIPGAQFTIHVKVPRTPAS